MNILAIGSHPDDIELGCVGTLFMHKKIGDKIFLLIITNGEKGGNPKHRIKEAKKSAKMIGAEIIVLDFPDGEIKEDVFLIKSIEKHIKSNKIDVLYTHSRNDRHQDHRKVAVASQIAMRYVKECYSYETPLTPTSFMPKMFVDITKVFKKKMACVNCHISQATKYYVKHNALSDMSSFRALNMGFPDKKFEAFEVNKILKR